MCMHRKGEDQQSRSVGHLNGLFNFCRRIPWSSIEGTKGISKVFLGGDAFVLHRKSPWQTLLSACPTPPKTEWLVFDLWV